MFPIELFQLLLDKVSFRCSFEVFKSLMYEN